jgi:hypothetical protein
MHCVFVSVTHDFLYSFCLINLYLKADLSMLSLSSYHVYTDRNYEKVCEACHITLNKCAIYGSISSGGVRIGEYLSYSSPEVNIAIVLVYVNFSVNYVCKCSKYLYLAYSLV